MADTDVRVRIYDQKHVLYVGLVQIRPTVYESLKQAVISKIRTIPSKQIHKRIIAMVLTYIPKTNGTSILLNVILLVTLFGELKWQNCPPTIELNMFLYLWCFRCGIL